MFTILAVILGNAIYDAAKHGITASGREKLVSGVKEVVSEVKNLRAHMEKKNAVQACQDELSRISAA